MTADRMDYLERKIDDATKEHLDHVKTCGRRQLSQLGLAVVGGWASMNRDVGGLIASVSSLTQAFDRVLIILDHKVDKP